MRQAYKRLLPEEKELLALSGIRALHPAQELNASLIFEWGGVPEKPKEIFVKIRSRRIELYYLLINKEDKFITNFFFETTWGDYDCYERIFKEQLKNATKFQYKFIYTYSRRFDDSFIFMDEIFPYSKGYKIFGEFGYLMANPSDEMGFAILMKNNGIKNIRMIHQIYILSIQARKGKVLWDNEGKSWVGRFNLEEKSLSRRILDKLA